MTARTTEVAPAPENETFSAKMKRQTWVDHDDAEYTGYMQALLGGELTKEEYADMVAQHYYAYLVIEDAAKQLKDDPVAGPFINEGLHRLEALEADLEYLLGADWREKIKPNAGTEEYVARLKEVCYTSPGAFVAHHYTRYLGDLSGGQIIRAATIRAFDLKDNEGVQFYVFPQIPDYKAFKIDYRDALDAAPWSDEEQQEVIDEVLVAYRLNTKVLVDCGRASKTLQAKNKAD